jgi:DNA-binding LacI/PurR family transcriptional regulator
VPTRDRSRRPTLRDVAALAGVSVQTASNVARRRYGSMQPSTRARVEGAMRTVGYHPNVAARGLRQARARALGFLVVDESPSFLASRLTALLTAGIADVARESDYGVLVHSADTTAAAGTLARPLLEQRVDAAAVLVSGAPAQRRRQIERLAATGAPIVVFDEPLGPADGALLGVRSDERAAARALTEHLLAAGHERIAFVAPEQPWAVLEQRRGGYRDALAAAGREPLTAEPADRRWRAEYGEHAAQLLLAGPRPPTAILCGNDLLALGAIRGARRLGLSVPRDVAVAGFDDFDFAALVDPPLTTVRLSPYELGHAAASMLIDVLEGRPVAQRHVTVANELVLRASA